MIPCAILELFGTIPESADKVGIPTLRRTIPELSRFLHCAEHIYFKGLGNIRLDIHEHMSMDLKLVNVQSLPFHSPTFRLQI